VVRPELLEVGAELEQALGPGTVHPPSSNPGHRDEAAPLEHAEVLGDGRPGHGEASGNLSRRELTAQNQLQDRSPAGLGDGFEGRVHLLTVS